MHMISNLNIQNILAVKVLIVQHHLRNILFLTGGSNMLIQHLYNMSLFI